MTNRNPAASHGTARPTELHANGRPVRTAALLGGVGGMEVLLEYLALRVRLPAQVPWQFGLNGQTTGTLGPLPLLGIELVLVTAVTLAFTGALWWGSRSVPLASQFGSRLVRPLLTLQGVIVAGVLPLVFGLQFASAAGVLGISGPNFGILLNVMGVLIALIIILLALVLTASLVPTLPNLPSEGPPARATFAVGGPIELACSACGQRFRLSGVPIFVLRVGIGRFGSLYIPCPRCGERSWDKILGRVAT
jgi:hypothetical protein